jgi:hypothetical protein
MSAEAAGLRPRACAMEALSSRGSSMCLHHGHAGQLRSVTSRCSCATVSAAAGVLYVDYVPIEAGAERLALHRPSAAP